ncbi:hypothetical protein Ae201684P_021643 [Aphanomyces euteiches]|nr:hypothetical protein Ae201684P_021643 [Aphanomyces euteiches]
MPGSKTKHVRLELAQKMAIVEHYDLNPRATLEKVAAWTQLHFDLERRPTISRILRNKVDEDRAKWMPHCKTYRSIASDTLVERILHWINLCEKHEVPIVTYRTIREKATQFSVLDNSGMNTSRSFSNGWIHRLLMRNCLSSRQTRGEAASVDKENVVQARNSMLELTRKYDPIDVYNMDETAFFYRKPPTRSISRNPMSGFKVSKKQMTVVVASNATGSDKIPLLFIGNAQKPRAFKRLTPQELNIDYSNTKKGWMTSQVFSDWVRHFNSRMASEDRRVILIVDNAPSHRVDEDLSNVTLRFLPPNTTSVLQPMDSGVIAAFKSHIRRIQTRYLVDECDKLFRSHEDSHSPLSVKEIERIFAINWATEAWANVTQTTIRNCWLHAGIVDEGYHDLLSRVKSLRVHHPTICDMSV